MHNATRVVRAASPGEGQGQPFLPGPTFAGTYRLRGDPGKSEYTYGRYGNPTWSAYEAARTDLEMASGTVVFSSGLAGVAATLWTCLSPGGVLVMPSDAYYSMRSMVKGPFAQMGVKTRFYAAASGPSSGDLPGASLLWIESPSNPGLDVCDIAQLCTEAHELGVLVAVDNTTATCLGQQPLSLGADFCVSSDTKATTGHSDLTLGHVSTLDDNMTEGLRGWRQQMGSVPGPMEVWLAHRSLITLHVRLERQCQNALAVAESLSKREDVFGVRYPGLPHDPAHEVASRQMDFFGPIIGFSLRDCRSAERFLGHSQLIAEATSFGGAHTTAERRARWGGDSIPEGFIRLSIGCEDKEDLLGDIAESLDRVAHDG